MVDRKILVAGGAVLAGAAYLFLRKPKEPDLIGKMTFTPEEQAGVVKPPAAPGNGNMVGYVKFVVGYNGEIAVRNDMTMPYADEQLPNKEYAKAHMEQVLMKYGTAKVVVVNNAPTDPMANEAMGYIQAEAMSLARNPLYKIDLVFESAAETDSARMPGTPVDEFTAQYGTFEKVPTAAPVYHEIVGPGGMMPEPTPTAAPLSYEIVGPGGIMPTPEPMVEELRREIVGPGGMMPEPTPTAAPLSYEIVGPGGLEPISGAAEIMYPKAVPVVYVDKSLWGITMSVYQVDGFQTEPFTQYPFFIGKNMQTLVPVSDVTIETVLAQIQMLLREYYQVKIMLTGSTWNVEESERIKAYIDDSVFGYKKANPAYKILFVYNNDIYNDLTVV